MPPVQDERRPVPVRTILATIGLVLGTVVALYLVWILARIEALLIVAAFFAVVLTSPVDFLSRHLRVKRGIATLLVLLLVLAVFSALMYAFIRPLVRETRHFVENFPQLLAEAKEGKGPAGRWVKRYQLDERLERNQDRIRQEWGSRLGGGALKAAGTVLSGVAALLTVLVLAVLMILYGPGMLQGALGVLSPPTAERVRAVGADCAKAVTGYVFGNLLISVIAGTVTFFALLAFGVPYPGVLALWVGFADLIPLVGATLGAIPTVLVAFLHSTAAGIGMIVVYVVYQQFENHVLQVTIMSKTVQINQLFVLVSVLVGVELFGILGALLAIPAAGVIQVIARDVWDHRRGRFKEEPTVGEDRIPVSEASAEQPAVEEARAAHETAEEAGAEAEEAAVHAAEAGARAGVAHDVAHHAVQRAEQKPAGPAPGGDGPAPSDRASAAAGSEHGQADGAREAGRGEEQVRAAEPGG